MYLTDIIIPKNVKSIKEKIFFDCKNITVNCEVNKKPKGWDDNWNYLVKNVRYGEKKR